MNDTPLSSIFNMIQHPKTIGLLSSICPDGKLKTRLENHIYLHMNELFHLALLPNGTSLSFILVIEPTIKALILDNILFLSKLIIILSI